MGATKKTLPVKLVIAFIFKDAGPLKKAKLHLRKQFGEIDFESEILPFTYTAYYKSEFGKNLVRQFIGFRTLIFPQHLVKIKILSSAIEEKLAHKGRRKVNIDPGYVSLSKFVLASTKDYTHRLYLGRGIFGEITLIFQGKTFRPWDWTYPDYRSSPYISILNHLRELYRKQLQP